jgi:hypothetical protein
MTRIDRAVARGGYWFLLFVATAASITAPSTAQSPSGLGTPLPGLSPVEFEEFRLGLDDFLEVEATEEGLGPAFNGTSCAVCHSIPTIGGAGTMAELRAGRRLPNGEFETLDGSGDTLFHSFSVPGHCSARASSRRFPMKHCGASKILSIATATASVAGLR